MPENLTELNSILHSGALAYGAWGKKFEKAIQNYINCNEEVLVVNSYNTAIQIALSVLDINPGDEIIASPQSCLASTLPLATFGVQVIWADIDPSRGTLCPESVELHISAKTKAIFHNHHCGYPGYIDEINAIGKKKGIFVIDDCIESFGSIYKENKLGNTGTDVTLFSFQTVRLPNTIDGGCLIFKDPSHYKKAIKVRDLGIDRDIFRDSIGEINPVCDIGMKAYAGTMSEINSYIGYCQMTEIETLLAKQRGNAKQWEGIFEEIEKARLLQSCDTIPNYWVFGVLSDSKMQLLQMFRNKGYYCSGVHIPNTLYSVFGQQDNLAGVDEFYSKFLALPSGWWANIQ